MIGNDDGKFGRLITAMATPFDDELKLDFKAVERLVEHLLETGTDSIIVAGTTGESPTLEEGEKHDLLKAVLEAAGKRARIIVGTGSNDTARTVRATEEAEKAGAHGVLVVAPYYNKPNQEGLLAHFSAVAGATSLPLIIYNIPGRTGINIAPETLVELARRHDNVQAVKDSTGNVDQAAEIAGRAPDNFRVYSGDDYLTLPFLAVGACGVVSVASHIAGTAIRQMMDFFFAGNIDDARRLHYGYLPLFKGLFTAPNPTCLKYALSKLGICKPHLRLPLVPLSDVQREALDRVLSETKMLAKV